MKSGAFTGHWDELFKQLEREQIEAGETRPSVIVANTKPQHETARNLYQEDKEEIERAAKNNGFKCISRLKHIHFLKILPLPIDK
jgi:galactokinase